MRSNHEDSVPFTDGTACINIAHWRELPKFIEDNNNLKGYIFRGHTRSAFTLVPRIVRLYQEKHSLSEFDDGVLRTQLRRFRLYIRGRLTLTDREAISESEVWAIGQHNDLATPLLDWTTSPLVAAFFAFIDDRPFTLPDDLDERALNQQVAQYRTMQDEARTIFVLNARKVNSTFYAKVEELDALKDVGGDLEEYQQYKEDEPEEGQGFPERVVEHLYPVDADTYNCCRLAVNASEMDAPRIISPLSGDNPRLVNQRGLFTKYQREEPLEAWVKRECAHTSEAILLKIDIANSQRAEALRWLEVANIDYLSLFFASSIPRYSQPAGAALFGRRCSKVA